MTIKPYWRDMNDGLKYQPSLVFDGGILSIKGKGYGDKGGDGELVVKDDDLGWPSHSEDAGYRTLPLPRSELEAIRKHIASCHGPYSGANPRVTDNDAGEITVSLDGKELRGWSYADDGERRQKMLQAREYVEGWCDGRDHKAEPSEKIKYWWSEDRQWFCILASDGTNSATVSLNVEEAEALMDEVQKTPRFLEFQKECAEHALRLLAEARSPAAVGTLPTREAK